MNIRLEKLRRTMADAGMGRTDAELHEYQLREIGRADKSAVRFALLQISIL